MSDLRVSVVTNTVGLDALRPHWDRLVATSQSGSVFVGADWLFPWWRHYGGSHALRVLVVRDGDDVVGILPVYLHTVRELNVVPVRILRFMGTGGDTAPDDLDALLHPGLESEAAQAMAAYLLADLRDWDVLHLTDIPVESVFRGVLEAGLESRGVSTRQGVSASISWLRLDTTWSGYLEQQNRHRRYAIRRARRIVEALPGASFYCVSEKSVLDAAIDRLIVLHRLRWEARAEHHAFSSSTYNSFHREVMHLLLTSGGLRLYCLEWEGVVVAMSYCYRFRNKIFHFQSGFDPAHGKLSPGAVLMGYAIEHAMAEGNDAFDMLRGEYEYKTWWAPERRETRFVQGYRSGLRSFAYRMRRQWLPALKRRLRRLTDEPSKAVPARGDVAGNRQELPSA